MSLIVVGLNHRTAPVDLLERMTVPDEQLAKVLHDLGGREHLLEVVVLSTCNRIEVYARCTHFHPAVGDVSAFLAGVLGRRARRVRRPRSTRTTTTPRSRTCSRSRPVSTR